jgi:hypothetical protein
MHGRVLAGKQPSDLAEPVLHDPPAVVVTPDREPGGPGCDAQAMYSTSHDEDFLC